MCLSGLFCFWFFLVRGGQIVVESDASGRVASMDVGKDCSHAQAAAAVSTFVGVEACHRFDVSAAA